MGISVDKNIFVDNEEHKWQVCIGVQYGTSLCEVADSTEQNVSYKIALARTKKKSRVY